MKAEALGVVFRSRVTRGLTLWSAGIGVRIPYASLRPLSCRAGCGHMEKTGQIQNRWAGLERPISSWGD